MTKRIQRPIQQKSSALRTTTEPGATSGNAMEQRVLALAEQLGRIVGTIQAKTSGWMNDDTLKQELARVRDGAASLLTQFTEQGNAAPQKPAASATPQKPPAAAAPAGIRKRSGGAVDAPGKKRRPRMPADPDASHVRSQTAKMRAAKTMVKTHRRRGRA